jgi:hypothetical protein
VYSHATTAKKNKVPNAAEPPSCLNTTGKSVDITRFADQWAVAAIPPAAPRTLTGKTSAATTQGTGDTPAWNDATYSICAPRVTRPRREGHAWYCQFPSQVTMLWCERCRVRGGGDGRAESVGSGDKCGVLIVEFVVADVDLASTAAATAVRFPG